MYAGANIWTAGLAMIPKACMQTPLEIAQLFRIKNTAEFRGDNICFIYVRFSQGHLKKSKTQDSATSTAKVLRDSSRGHTGTSPEISAPRRAFVKPGNHPRDEGLWEDTRLEDMLVV